MSEKLAIQMKMMLDGQLRDAIEFEARMYVAVETQEIASVVLTEAELQRDETWHKLNERVTS